MQFKVAIEIAVGTFIKLSKWRWRFTAVSCYERGIIWLFQRVFVAFLGAGVFRREFFVSFYSQLS